MGPSYSSNSLAAIFPSILHEYTIYFKISKIFTKNKLFQLQFEEELDELKDFLYFKIVVSKVQV